MKKKLAARIKSAVIAVFTAAALTTSAYGAEAYDNSAQISDLTDPGGACMYDSKTGEEKYIPPSDINTYSSETEGSVPSYDPYSDKQKPVARPQPLTEDKRDENETASDFESFCVLGWLKKADMDTGEEEV